MDKTIIAIGGGELKAKTTLKIDEYIAKRAKARAKAERAYGLFIPTASHDSMPYFNSFRKTYTSIFDIKADVALTVYNEMSIDKIEEKFRKADFIYVGGGDTVFMLEHWKKSGMLDLITEAYNGGTMICGLSAGAICWFDGMYTDSVSLQKNVPYEMRSGLGWVKENISPHYNLRALDFDEILIYNNIDAIGLEDNSAIEIVNGSIARSISAGGKAYRIKNIGGSLLKTAIE